MPNKKKTASKIAKNYDHLEIEPKWQKIWKLQKIGQVKEDTKKPKFYSLIEFPYPSGEGLHVGHIRSNTAMDIISRKRRREGYNVLYPIGWDAFGLPTENYALKTGIQPTIVTKKNTDIFRRQLQALGFSFDWSREVNTTDPKYYKWTQWIFLQFFKKGLAYKKKLLINWCPKDLIGLANEEVINGCCERCGTKVEQKEKEQWLLAITKYADRLDKDLDQTEFLEKIKIQQRNWIGRSEGAEITFKIVFAHGQKLGAIPVFTTRPDTLFGVTAFVLSPEHLWITLALDQKHQGVLDNAEEVRAYVKKAKEKTEIERTDAKKEKTGIELRGVKAINPANGEEVPIWVADYVLANYGTGAVMMVPAHDERDFEFAQKYKIAVKQVIAPFFVDKENVPRLDKKWGPRRVIQVVVKHPTEDKIIQIQWKNLPWKTLVIGGAEGDEPYEQAVAREVKEETGYKNFGKLEKLGWQMEAHFYAKHKDVNRQAFTQVFTLQLKDLEKDELTEEESSKHSVVWVPASELDKSFGPISELPEIIRHWKDGPRAFVENGKIINSSKFSGLDSEMAKKEITKAFGQAKISYKLKDWIFSRQRYWGEPIPVVHCEKCGTVAVPEKDLPVKLPVVKNYKPTETGESPLASISKWVNTKCPKCRGPAKRETDTMPNWAGSSWYYLRYTDPKNSKEFANPKNLKYWTPVDWYNGGMEHTTLHLLYSRFWHKFLFDLGLVPTSEPYKKRTSHGLILAEGGEKMSKSKGNVINPDGIIKLVGADTLRLHEMFMGPFDQAIAWDSGSIAGSRRFIERVWKLQEKVILKSDLKEVVLIHKTIKKVSEDIEEMRFNTAISSLMILLNQLEKEAAVSKENYEIILQLLAPFAPHVTEEIWANLGHKKSIHLEKWPEFDPKKIVTEKITVVVQINGKPRAILEITPGTSQAEVEKTVFGLPEVAKWLAGKNIKKKLFIKEKILSIVTD